MGVKREEIEARLRAATPGPWTATEDVTRRWHVDANYHGPERDYVPIADVKQGRADADFIAHAYDDIGFLLNTSYTAAHLSGVHAKIREALDRVTVTESHVDRDKLDEWWIDKIRFLLDEVTRLEETRQLLIKDNTRNFEEKVRLRAVVEAASRIVSEWHYWEEEHRDWRSEVARQKINAVILQAEEALAALGRERV